MDKAKVDIAVGNVKIVFFYKFYQSHLPISIANNSEKKKSDWRIPFPFPVQNSSATWCHLQETCVECRRSLLDASQRLWMHNFFNVGTFLNINDNQTHEYWFLRGTLCCNNRPFCPLKMMMTKVTIYVGGNLIIRIIQAALQLFLKKGKFQYKTLFYECTYSKLPIQPHFCQKMMGIQHQQQASLDKINFCISDVTCCVVFW